MRSLYIRNNVQSKNDNCQKTPIQSYAVLTGILERMTLISGTCLCNFHSFTRPCHHTNVGCALSLSKPPISINISVPIIESHVVQDPFICQ